MVYNSIVFTTFSFSLSHSQATYKSPTIYILNISVYVCAPVPIIKQNKTFLFVFIKSNYKGMDKLLKIRFQSEKENLFDLNFFNNKIAKKKHTT